MELRIIQCDNGYVLISEIQVTATEKETVYDPVEDDGNSQDCLKRMLLRVAEHFGFQYDKFNPDNLEITFNRKGHKVE